MVVVVVVAGIWRSAVVRGVWLCVGLLLYFLRVGILSNQLIRFSPCLIGYPPLLQKSNQTNTLETSYVSPASVISYLKSGLQTITPTHSSALNGN